MAEKELIARVRVEADDAQPIEEIEQGLRSLDRAGEQASDGLDKVAASSRGMGAAADKAGDQSEQAARDVDELEDQTRQLSRALDRAKVDLREFVASGKGLDRLKASAGGVKDAFSRIGIGVVTEAVRRSIGAIIEASREQVQAMAQVEAAITSTNTAAGLLPEDLQRIANGLEKITGVGDDLILKMQSVLLTFTKIGREIFPQVSEVILDVATRMDGNLKEAAIQVGKALNDPIKGLSALADVGVSFTKQQKEQVAALQASGDLLGAQKVILAELAVEFGGSARAARENFAGSLDAASTAGRDLLAAIGENGLNEALRIVADQFADAANAGEFASTLQEAGKVAGTFILTLSLVVQALAGLKSAGQVAFGGLIVAADRFEIRFRETLSRIADAFGKTGIAESLREGLEPLREALEKNVETLEDAKERLGDTGLSLRDEWDRIAKIWEAGAKSIEKVDTSGIAKALEKSIRSMKDAMASGRRDVGAEVEALRDVVNLGRLADSLDVSKLSERTREQLKVYVDQLAALIEKSGAELEPAVAKFRDALAGIRVNVSGTGLRQLVPEAQAVGQAIAKLAEDLKQLEKSEFSEQKKKIQELLDGYKRLGKEVPPELAKIADSLAVVDSETQAVLDRQAAAVKAAVADIRASMGELSASQTHDAESIRLAWDTIDPTELGLKFQEISDASRRELVEKFKADVEAIRGSGGAISQEMVALGQQIGVLISAYDPVSKKAVDTMASVASETSKAGDELRKEIDQLATKLKPFQNLKVTIDVSAVLAGLDSIISKAQEARGAVESVSQAGEAG